MKTISYIHSRKSFATLALALTTLVAASNTFAQTSNSSGAISQHSMAKTKVGLSGYCPVCVVEHKKWEKGNPSISSTFDGVSYHFPSKSIKAKFDANPQKYVPALNGDCIVCYEKMGKRVAGSVQHPALHNGRLYLFPGEGERKAFLANPEAFEDSDLAANGECVVCLAKANKHVPGSAEQTVLHNGLRFQFPSANEANAFRQSPNQFISQIGSLGKVEMMKSTAPRGIRLVGRSGCAACEFGVTPLGAPDQLGLAVVGRDGRITVVEGAHKDYPQIYEHRFEGKQLAVEGKIVKTQGKINWLEPTSVEVIN